MILAMNEELERGVIGIALQDNATVFAVELERHYFSDLDNQIIWDAILKFSKDKEVFDAVTISDYLESKTNRRWIEYLGKIAFETLAPSIDKAIIYANKLREHYQKQTAINLAQDLIHGLSTNSDTVDIQKTANALMDISKSKKNHKIYVKQSLAEMLEDIELARESDGIIGYPTGLPCIDEVTGGYVPGELTIIAGRPGMAKTSLALNGVIAAPVRSLIISSETYARKITSRLAVIKSQIHNQKIRKGKLFDDDWPALNKSIADLMEKDFITYDEPRPSIGTVQSVIREAVLRDNIGIVFVDYLQNLKGSNIKESKVNQCTEIADTLSEIAGEFHIPVVALAQVNREVEKRPDKRPYISDISDCSQIEKAADVIMMLYRDEYYYPDTTQQKGVAEIIIGKMREGDVGTKYVKWEGKYFKFNDITEPTFTEFEDNNY